MLPKDLNITLNSTILQLSKKGIEMEEVKDKLNKTGTTTVAVVCKDGVVLAADKRSSAGFMVAHKKVKKILPITDWIAVTTAGTVSDIQLLVKLSRAEIKLKDLQTNRASSVKETANLVSGLVYANFRKPSLVPGITSFLLAGKDSEGFHCYTLGVDGSVLEVDDYAADGSGEVFALGVFETLYKKGVSVEEGIKLAVRAVNAALQRDPMSGNGIDVVTITEKGIQTVMEKELALKLEA